ncbi:NUDIX hydrolase [Streptomyces sp. AJS327]|uniref:NUDIX domain-containing protein n=1 Tax=Streptomyces sp. AJS327 TaxID=2545265 RepID=UPI0015DFF544|nr:NUDIX hydrolase [Streptomyces sp. AJS327]MBA0053200.1 NUDIX hydrolase [Streptomyces sp. AJS327]
MHTEYDFSHPPGRRLGALALITNPEGHILLVEKIYRKEKGDPHPWGLPGGCAQPDEDLHDAFRRELLEETGQRVEPGDLLTVHHMPANPPHREGLNFVFDGGTLHPATPITLPQHELSAHAFVSLDDLHHYLAPHQLLRVRTAVRNALNDHRTAYLTAAHPTNDPQPKPA